MAEAPIKTDHEDIEPERKKAITMPGKTAWEMASPIMEILRKIKKHPNKAQHMETKEAVSMIKNAFMFICCVLVYW